MNNKLKRSIVWLLITVLLMAMPAGAPVMAADVADPDVVADMELLEALDIVCFDTSSLVLNEGFKKGDYITMLVNTIFDKGYKTANAEVLSLARGLGLIKSNDTRMNVFINYDEAVDMAMKLLGYSSLSGVSASKYLTAKNKLTKGIEPFGKYITAASSIKLVKNYIQTDILQIVEVYDDSVTIESYAGETPIAVYRGIYELEGLVDGTYETTLYGASSLGSDEVSISGTNYKTTMDCTEYIGYRVNAYVKYTKKHPQKTLMYMEPWETETLVIEPEDIASIPDKLTAINYYNDKGRQKTAGLEIAYKFIYNGVAVSDYTKSHMIPVDGLVTLINNDGDSAYEVVKVDSYETMLVNNVALNTKTIYNKLTYTGALKDLCIDKSVSDDVIYIEKYGMEAAAGDIAINDVITVAASCNTSGRKVIKAVVTAETAAGTVKVINTEDNIIGIDGKEYELTAQLVKASNSGDRYCKIPGVGEYTVAYIDRFGKIAAFSPLSDELYAYVVAWKAEGVFEKNVQLKVFNSDGDWEILTLDEKLTYNNSVSRIKSQDLYAQIGPDITPQLIRYRVDDDNVVKELSTAKSTTDTDTDYFSMRPERTMAYRSQNSSFNHELFVGDNCTMWWIPANPAVADEMDFMIIDKSWLTPDLSYGVTAYDVDDFYASNQIIITADSEFLKNRKSNNTVIVEKITLKLKSDGSSGVCITGIVESYSDFSIFVADGVDTSSIKPGDFLQVFIDTAGEISSFDRYYSSTDGILKSQLANTTLHTATPIGYVSGTVMKTKPSELRLLIQIDNSTSLIASKGASTTRITICNTADRKLSLECGTYSDIEPGDKVFVAMRNSTIRDIYVVK